MTEMSPLGTRLHASSRNTTELRRATRATTSRLKQGPRPFGVEMKIIDDAGSELPRDGKTFGHLMVRGPAVARELFQGRGRQILDEEGWFDTGDVATIDADGYMQITDRAKDVIKSGGEWISSIDLENLAVGHPGRRGSRGDRRRASEMGRAAAADRGAEAGRERRQARSLLAFMEGKIAKWWMPDDVVFVERNPAHRDRQDPEDGAARPVQGLPAAGDVIAT